MNARKEQIPAYIQSSLTLEGGRITKARRNVIAYFLSVQTPQSIQDIVRHVHADEVSVYRTVKLLKSRAIIEEIVFPDGTHRYAIAHEHHHHVICSSCERVAHIPCHQEVVSIPKIPKDFTSILSHSVTYYGVCETCDS